MSDHETRIQSVDSDLVTLMELAFDSISLREVCESERKALDLLGAEVAKTLRRRLADLRAAENIEDIKAGCLRIIGNKSADFITIDLCQNYTMVLSANHVQNPVLKSGEVDWSRVRRLKLLDIGNNNGQD